MKILSITSKAFPGICAVLEHGHNLGFWDIAYLEKGIPKITDYSGIIIAGTASQNMDIKKAFNTISLMANASLIPIALYWTSSIGQMEFTNGIETIIFRDYLKMMDKGELDYVFVGSKYLYESIKGNPKVKYAPYPFSNKMIKYARKQTKIIDSVGLFLPFHPRKNIFNQITAIRLAHSKRNSIIAYTNLKHFVVIEDKFFENRSWVEPEDYHYLVSQMKCILHVTHTESFGYAVAEAIALGTIPLVSMTISDNFEIFNAFDDMIVVNPDNPIEISEKINSILEMDNESYNMRIKSIQDDLDEKIGKRNIELKKVLEECFSEKK